ncbi:acetyltransferase [Pseudomonas sp. TMW22090]|uniref:acetyltransferase n=1 Tax=Pseudomonas sp. TMW22090 TaxID=2506434 RepID=UPI001F0FC7BD|nr:acetyltransferase [Pseudomonas sp. TMW22090]MCH4880161.1 acetyltransferase [Pseudomonas sp. TMW22090]
MDVYGIYGAGGYGREVLPVVKNMMDKLSCFMLDGTVVFIVDDPEEAEVNGCKVMTPDEFLNSDFENKYFNIAIGDSSARERISSRMEIGGAKPFTIRHENVVVFDGCEIHDSAILSPFTCITSNAKIGKYFHANLYSYVAHDCVIGDFVTFAPGVKCNGNVTIEDHAYIGTGAIIKQGTPKRPITIGKGAIVGMGAVVTKSVPPGVTVIGNPARPLGKEALKS